ncbi:MAG: multiheme c-type cytochrome, partial [Bacteriovoracia bacterium]
LIRAHKQLGHKVVVPGEKDFALGVDTLMKLKQPAKFVFLAANIKRKGKLLLKASHLFKYPQPDGRTLRVLVIGAVGAQLDWPKELEVGSAVAAVKREVSAHQGKADLFIAVTHQGVDEDEVLAQAVPELDAIVGGHTQSFLQTPKKVGKTLILQSSYQNQYIGLLPLTRAPLSDEKHQLTSLDESLDIAPAVPPANDADAKKFREMEALVKEFKEAVAKLNSKQTPGLSGSTGGNRPNPHAAYQTFVQCADCHTHQFDFWRKTKHADALTPLVNQKQIRNLECLGCHTLALGQKHGFHSLDRVAERSNPKNLEEREQIPIEKLAVYLRRIHEAQAMDTKVKTTDEDLEELPLDDSLSRFSKVWAPVQCESCHGPAGSHPVSGAYGKSVANDRCLTCHTSTRAPQWWKGGKPDLEVIAQKRKLVSCPADPKP